MPLTTDQIAQAAFQAGFRGQALQWMTQIAMRESGGNPGAYNPNVKTGDNSWGLWQINTLGGNGPNIRRMLQSIGRSGDFQDLKDPTVNAQIAYKLSGGGTNFEPWRSHSPGWEGPQGWLTNTQQYEQSAKSLALRVQMGKASSNTSWLNGVKAAQQGNGSFFSKLTGWVTQQLGKPYKFGSQGMDSFDCSGLISAAYRQMGINIPALTFSQKNYGVQVDATDLQPGDLMLAHGSQGDFGHVGIYMGGGQVIDAPHTGAVVRTTSVDDWLPRVTGKGGMVRRLVDAQGRVITGAGLTPQVSGDVQTVAFTDMSKGVLPDSAASLGDVLGGSPQSASPAFKLDRQPITSLPGLGRTVNLI